MRREGRRGEAPRRSAKKNPSIEEIGLEQRAAYRRIVGYELRCAWDTEHGVGVITHEDRVVEVSQADTALLGAHDPARDVRQTSRLGSVRSPRCTDHRECRPPRAPRRSRRTRRAGHRVR